MPLADVENDFSRREVARGPTCKAGRRLDLRRIEFGEELVAAGIGK